MVSKPVMWVSQLVLKYATTPQKASQKDIIASQKSLGASQKAIIEMVSSNLKVTSTQMAESLDIDRRNI